MKSRKIISRENNTIPLFRVFDVEVKNRTIYVGEEKNCANYVSKANNDAGFIQYDYCKTTWTYKPFKT